MPVGEPPFPLSRYPCIPTFLPSPPACLPTFHVPAWPAFTPSPTLGFWALAVRGTMSADLLRPLLHQLRAAAPQLAANGWLCQQTLVALAFLRCRDDELVSGIAQALTAGVQGGNSLGAGSGGGSTLGPDGSGGSSSSNGGVRQVQRDWQQQGVEEDFLGHDPMDHNDVNYGDSGDWAGHSQQHQVGSHLLANWSAHDIISACNALAALGYSDQRDLVLLLIDRLLNLAKEAGSGRGSAGGHLPAHLVSSALRSCAVLDVFEPQRVQRLLQLAGACDVGRWRLKSLGQLQQSIMWLQVRRRRVGVGVGKPRGTGAWLDQGSGGV